MMPNCVFHIGKVFRVKPSDIKRVLGIDFHNLQRFLNGVFVTYDNRKYVMRDDYMDTNEIEELCENNSNLQDIRSYMTTSNIHILEVNELDKWGLVEIYGKEYIVTLNGKPHVQVTEGIKISKGGKGMKKRNQGTWEAISQCPHCGSDMHYSMTISDGSRGRGRITVTDQEGQPIDTTIKSIGLYYCPQCMKFVALNDMLHV